jgi:hypothetical protein
MLRRADTGGAADKAQCTAVAGSYCPAGAFTVGAGGLDVPAGLPPIAAAAAAAAVGRCRPPQLAYLVPAQSK